MNKKKKIPLTIVCIVSLLIATCSFATHYYYATLDELVRKSDFVFVGEVTTVGRTIMGYRKAKLRVMERIKGAVLSEMPVKYGEPWYSSQVNVPILTEGKQYLFFLVKGESEYLLAGITGPTYYLVYDNGEVLCGDKAEAVKKCIERGRSIVSDQEYQEIRRDQSKVNLLIIITTII